VSATIAATANQLDFDDLLALGAAFSGTTGADVGATESRSTITVTVTAPRARLAGVAATRFEASVLADGIDVRVEPLRFDLFGGRFDGWIDAGFGDAIAVRIGAGLSNLDVAQLAAFGGAEGAMTGRLFGSGRFGAEGESMGAAMGAMRGVGEASISDGSIRYLQLLRPVLEFVRGEQGSDRTGGEGFDSITATFALADRVVRSDDLTFRASDFDVFARGTLGLADKALDARAQVVLSEALSARVPGNVARFTLSGSRIVVPASVSGSLTEPRVRIDAAAALRRGVQNEVERRLQDLLERVKPSS
jgi:AsmA protein